jgi:hypothetical protein
MKYVKDIGEEFFFKMSIVFLVKIQNEYKMSK